MCFFFNHKWEKYSEPYVIRDHYCDEDQILYTLKHRYQSRKCLKCGRIQEKRIK